MKILFKPGNKTGLRHGLYGTSIYKTWIAMKSRCTNPSDASYHYYGGRGITICERWLNSVTAFAADMGERPEGLSLDRINNNGNYELGNCRWATLKEQNRNRRGCREITFNGKTGSAAFWAEEMNLPRQTLVARFDAGWSTEKALLTPLTVYDSLEVRRAKDRARVRKWHLENPERVKEHKRNALERKRAKRVLERGQNMDQYLDGRRE